VEAIVQLEGFIIRRGFYESPRRIQRGIDLKTAFGGLNFMFLVEELTPCLLIMQDLLETRADLKPPQAD